MRNRLVVGIAAPTALTLLVALSACASSSTIDGQGGTGPDGATSSTGPQTGGESSSSSPSSATSSGTSPGAPSTANPAVSLAARLTQGLSRARTAHLELNIGVAGQSIKGSGDEQLSKGRLVALDLTETVAPTVSLRLIVSKGKTYVRLPGSLNQSAKPWQLVSASSSNPTVRKLASTLASTQSSASLASVTAFVAAARSVHQIGTSAYAIDVDPAKLPGDFEGKQALIQSGLTSIPVKIRLDSADRPVLVSEHFTVSGEKVTTTVTIGAYDKPVHITAPPASQVNTH